MNYNYKPGILIYIFCPPPTHTHTHQRLVILDNQHNKFTTNYLDLVDDVMKLYLL